MRDLLLVISTLAIFIYGYFVIKKLDDCIEKNQRVILTESKNNFCQIKIAAESPIQLDFVATALETCSESNPYIEFSFLCGKSSRLLQKLKEESIDIVLLSDNNTEKTYSDFAFTKIPYENRQMSETVSGLSFKSIEEENSLYVVWNKCVKSKNRDRVIFALENGYYTLRMDAQIASSK